jgi:hypothetical protein
MMYIRQIYKTQVAEAATTQQGAGPRQFNAVHGAKGEEGELFGTCFNVFSTVPFNCNAVKLQCASQRCWHKVVWYCAEVAYTALVNQP